MKALIAALILAVVASPLTALAAGDPAWSAPHAPYRVAGNIYYVGTAGIGVYLIATTKGAILLDASTEEGAGVVEANIQALGFKLSDVKYLIETHAHVDHIGGMARLKRDTGATFIAAAADRHALESGRHDIDNEYGGWTFPPVKIDRTITDGQRLTVGGTTLTAHLTPGHTRGDTAWTTDISDNGVIRRVLFYGSTTTAGNVLVGNRSYPNIVADYRLSFRRLKALTADILLANHPEFADLEAKYQAQLKGKADAFVDPQALPKLVARSEADFETELKRQQAAHEGKRP